MTHRAVRGIASWQVLIGLGLAVLGIWGVSRMGRGSGQDRVLAKVAGERITVGEVEAANSGAFLQLTRQRHELLEQGLDEIIGRRLLDLEASARGVTPEQLWATEVDGRVVEPSDAAVDSFYRVRGITIVKDSIAPRIRDYLREEQRVRASQAFLAQLRDTHQVTNYLEPERSQVEADGHPAKGPAEAPVTIVEFADFECPYCVQVLPTLARLQATYRDEVRLVFRQFPLRSIHRFAQQAAEASLCAWEQDKFWEMHDVMFANQRALGRADLKATAAQLGLDSTQFNACFDSGKFADRVAADFDAARRLGLTGTPAFFINGRFLSGAQPYEAIAAIVDDELRRAGH